MFISYFEPLVLRQRVDLCIHYFYIQLQNYGIKDVIYITGEDFFSPAKVWKQRNCIHLSDSVRRYLNFDYPSDETLKNAKKEFVPKSIYHDLYEKCKDNETMIEKFLLTESYKPLNDYFLKTLKKLTDEYEIEAILTLKNCPSLELAAKEFNIPVIHYEAAALRLYDYQFLMYYDYSGVNGNTSAEEGYKQFKKEYETNKNKIKLLTNEEIIQLMSWDYHESDITPDKENEYKIGAALQVYNDSNIIAFSNGYNSELLIDKLCKLFNEDEIIIRNHPCTTESKLLNFKNIDHSPRASDFIKRCEKIITINSNVGYEAALYNKPVYILGHSPYKILSEDINNINGEVKNIFEKDRNLKINYLTFVYLVPYDLLYDIEYLRFRLKNPSLTDIYNYNLKYCLNKYMQVKKKELVSLTLLEGIV